MPESILKEEIKAKLRNLNVYTQLAQEVASKQRDLEAIRRLTNVAIDYENLPALLGLAKVNRFVVSQELVLGDRLKVVARKAAEGSTAAIELFLLLRSELQPEQLRVFQRLAQLSILKTSLRLRGRALHHRSFL